MKTTYKLYGVHPDYFESMLYFEAVEAKITLVKTKIKELLTASEESTSWEDVKIIEDWLTECYKALKFNENLLKEQRKEIR